MEFWPFWILRRCSRFKKAAFTLGPLCHLFWPQSSSTHWLLSHLVQNAILSGHKAVPLPGCFTLGPECHPLWSQSCSTVWHHQSHSFPGCSPALPAAPLPLWSSQKDLWRATQNLLQRLSLVTMLFMFRNTCPYVPLGA